MPEFLQKRFQSQWIRTYLTAVALISYVFTKTSVCLLHKFIINSLYITSTNEEWTHQFKVVSNFGKPYFINKQHENWAKLQFLCTYSHFTPQQLNILKFRQAIFWVVSKLDNHTVWVVLGWYLRWQCISVWSSWLEYLHFCCLHLGHHSSLHTSWWIDSRYLYWCVAVHNHDPWGYCFGNTELC